MAGSTKCDLYQGMISEAGKVRNGRFVSSGFLELYAPELTWEDSFVGANYNEYKEKLSDFKSQGYYIMVKLDIDGTNTKWVYLYEADGESLLAVCDGEIVNISDIAVGVVDTEMFFYHGTERMFEKR